MSCLFFSSSRRYTRWPRDWSSDVCSSDLFDILDSTKFWPEELIPVHIIGKMTLNRNVDNEFSEIEQAAFNPGNVVPRSEERRVGKECGTRRGQERRTHKEVEHENT